MSIKRQVLVRKCGGECVNWGRITLLLSVTIPPAFLTGELRGGSETPSFVALTETRELTVLALPRRDLEATPKITLIEFERTDYFLPVTRFCYGWSFRCAVKGWSRVEASVYLPLRSGDFRGIVLALGVKVRIDADEQQAGKCRWFQTMLFRDQDNNRNACLDGQDNFLPFIPIYPNASTTILGTWETVAPYGIRPSAVGKWSQEPLRARVSLLV